MAGCGGKKMAYGGMAKKKMKEGGMAKKAVPADKKDSLGKLPEDVRNKMGYMKKGGKVKKGYHMMPDGKMMKDSDHKKKMKKGGKVYCKDGCAVRGKTKGRMV